MELNQLRDLHKRWVDKFGVPYIDLKETESYLNGWLNINWTAEIMYGQCIAGESFIAVSLQIAGEKDYRPISYIHSLYHVRQDLEQFLRADMRVVWVNWKYWNAQVHVKSNPKDPEKFVKAVEGEMEEYE